MRKTVMLVLVTVGLVAIASASAINTTVGSAQAAGVQSAVASAFPGETWTQTYIAQQDFQRGFMFWVSTSKSIWVLVKADANATTGEWRVVKDTFVDGDQETDPALKPPSANLYQPRRGFGKLWRTPSELFDKLGWGTTPELEESTPLGYLAGANGAPGRYLLVTLGREVFTLNETTAGQPGGTWTLVGVNTPGNPNAPVATAAVSGPVVTAAATGAATQAK